MLWEWLTVSGVDVDEVLRDFLKERKLNGDFIARVSDRIWLRDIASVDDTESGTVPTNTIQLLEEVLIVYIHMHSCLCK